MRAEIRTTLLDVVARRPGGVTTTQICDALGAGAPPPLVLDSYLRELVREGAASREGSVFRLNGHAASAAPAPPAPPARPAATHPESAPVNETSKPCLRCKKIKPLEEFWKHPEGKFGRDPSCKECRRAAKGTKSSGRAAAAVDVKPVRQPRAAAPAGGLTVEVQRTFTVHLGETTVRLTDAQLDELTAWWKQARAER